MFSPSFFMNSYEVDKYLYIKYFFILKEFFTFDKNNKAMRKQFTSSQKNPLGKNNNIFLKSGEILKLSQIANHTSWARLNNNGVWTSITDKELFNILSKNEMFVSALTTKLSQGNSKFKTKTI